MIKIDTKDPELKAMIYAFNAIAVAIAEQGDIPRTLEAIHRSVKNNEQNGYKIDKPELVHSIYMHFGSTLETIHAMREKKRS